MKTIAIIGPESSGKTTLCQSLAEHFHAPWVPEYGRTYLENLERDINADDLVRIAMGHTSEIARTRQFANELLFIDTDIANIKIWSELQYDYCDPDLLQLWQEERHDFYLLNTPDLEWEPDPLRQFPDLQSREMLFLVYEQDLKMRDLPYGIVTGDGAKRWKTAVELVEAQL